jgi:RNA polymerase sigma factor (TIGR02999 family)
VQDEDRMDEITRLLHEARDGSPQALQTVFARLYRELHAIAQARAGRLVPGATLSPTELVHEVFLKLVAADLALQDRRHFLTCAARAMRQIMVDRARGASAEKRGGAQPAVTLGDAGGGMAFDLDVLDLDRALRDLAEIEPGLHELVELRFFAGLDIAAAAQLRGVSERTAQREWQRARALLALRLDPGVA